MRHYMLAIIVGCGLGYLFFPLLPGVLIGAFLGWMSIRITQLKAQITQQEQRLETLSNEVALLSLQKNTTAKPASATTAPVCAPKKKPSDGPLPADAPASQPDLTDPWLQTEATATARPEPIVDIAKPARPAAPDRLKHVFSQAWDKIRPKIQHYITGGNLMVRVGVLILFFGVAFLLRYVAERTVIPVEFRYLGIMAGAIAMLLFGWQLREKNRQYGLVLQGGAIGVLYLVVFGAFQIHQLLDATPAFTLMLGLVILTAILAILQNAMWLAAAGITGGFLAPVLVSTEAGSPISLFSYYLILNLGIAFIAFYRSWRLLNWLGFMFTFGIGTAWGTQSYHAGYFISTEPFLVSFLLLYILIPLLYAIKQPPELKGLVDGTLIFGTPVAFMGLQSQLVDGYTAIPHILPLSSAALGTIYVALAFLVRRKDKLDLLFESYIALAIAFLTLAIPLGFDGRITASIWAIEGAALIWVGLRQSRLLPRVSGSALVLVSAFFYIDAPAVNDSALFMLNADYLGSLLLALASFYSAKRYHQFRDRLIKPEKYAALIMLLFGYLCWFTGGLSEINDHFTGTQAWFGWHCFIALTSVLCWLSYQRIRTLSLFALGMFSAASGVFSLVAHDQSYPPATIWFNLSFASALIISGLSLWMAVYARQHQFSASHSIADICQWLLLWTGTVCLLGAGFIETHHFLPSGYKSSYFLVYTTVCTISLVIAHRQLTWSPLTQPVLLLLPVLAATLLVFAKNDWHLSAYHGWLIFPLAALVLFGSLKDLEQIKMPNSQDKCQYPLGYFHLASILVLTIALTWQFGKLFRPNRLDGISHWVIAVWGLAFSFVLIALRRCRNLRWPFQRFSYQLTVLLPGIMLLLLAGWILLSNLRDPGSLATLAGNPIPYIPLLNPIDMANLLALVVLTLWLNRYHRPFFKAQPRLNVIVPALLGFLWANASLLRGFHYILAIPFRFEPMFQSFVVESGLSILWGSIGLIMMVIAHRQNWRLVWISGAIVMAVVVVKLFVVEMSATGTMARIIAFITVGGLLLVVGYFAPVPPRETRGQSENNENTDQIDHTEANP